MYHALVLTPLAGALIAWFIPSRRQRPLVVPAIALLHLLMTASVILYPPSPAHGGWIMLDPLGAVILANISMLFMVCSCYAVGYLAYRQERPNRVFCSGLLVCLAAMTMASLARHLGLQWIAIETTTLSMAPLVYFNRNARSIEATWKYMLICSVGIALALLGIFFLAYATVVARLEPTLMLSALIADAPRLSPAWLRTAFVFILVGYGTKAGLAPLHTWKPDAYGEAPGLVGALLAGGLVNCALLGIIRMYQICMASGQATFFLSILLAMGFISVVFAAVFMTRQSDFKRMLAYSSVEHVGIIVVGLGLGKGALFGALLHMVNNSMTKGVLFLSSGNIHRSFNSKKRDVVRGGMHRLPWSGGLLLAGFFAISGSPPFGTFISEFTIISSAFTEGHTFLACLMLFFLAIIFIGMAFTLLPVLSGAESPHAERSEYRDRILTVAPPLVLILSLVLLGTWLPPAYREIIEHAAKLLEVPR